MTFTVNGHTNPQDHIKALRAQGMTAKEARIAERVAFFKTMVKRQDESIKSKPLATEPFAMVSHPSGRSHVNQISGHVYTCPECAAA